MRKVLRVSCLGGVGAFAGGARTANDELIKLAQNPKEWAMPAGDYANQRYSKLNQITAANVGKLQVAWTFSTGVLRGHEGGPLIVGNTMYVHTPFPNKVYALDLANENKIIWKYEPTQDPNVIPVMCCDTVNRGVAYGDGKIFLHQSDTTLVGKGSSIKTWQGDQWKIGGGCTWGWMSYDPALNLVYYGSGNPSTWNPKQRPGDNKWSMTIFARNPDTGLARWVYQMTPHDEWDYDGVNEMILSDQQVGGAERKLLTHFDRNGLGYTLDRGTGELLDAEQYDPKVNWTSGVDMDKSSPTYGRPKVLDQYSTDKQGEDHNNKGICPEPLGSQDDPPT